MFSEVEVNHITSFKKRKKNTASPHPPTLPKRKKKETEINLFTLVKQISSAMEIFLPHSHPP